MTYNILSNVECMTVKADSYILTALKSGDKSVIPDLLDTYGDKIQTFIFHMTRDHQLSEDLTQEVFIKLLANSSSINNLKTWLYAVARNHALNSIRSKKIETRVFSSLNPTEENQETLVKSIVHDALSMIKEPYRSALVLCTINNFTYEEAASVLNCNVKTLSTRLHRAREMLKRILGPML